MEGGRGLLFIKVDYCKGYKVMKVSEGNAESNAESDTPIVKKFTLEKILQNLHQNII